jgi:hypothetical protein
MPMIEILRHGIHFCFWGYEKWLLQVTGITDDSSDRRHAARIIPNPSFIEPDR